jgi:hypothetical protein
MRTRPPEREVGLKRTKGLASVLQNHTRLSTSDPCGLAPVEQTSFTGTLNWENNACFGREFTDGQNVRLATRGTKMILKLDLRKIESGAYEAYCTGQVAPSVHDSIAAALRHYGQDIPAEFARFVEVRYHEVSLGTTKITRLTNEPELMAQELVDLTAAVYSSIEEMKVVA